MMAKALMAFQAGELKKKREIQNRVKDESLR